MDKGRIRTNGCENQKNLISSFHVNSDIDRLYTKRDKGGRGLNSIADVYIAKIISNSRHLTEKSTTYKFLNLVLNHEQPTLVRPANELLKTCNIC